jgi:hypothetical protein
MRFESLTTFLGQFMAEVFPGTGLIDLEWLTASQVMVG